MAQYLKGSRGGEGSSYEKEREKDREAEQIKKKNSKNKKNAAKFAANASSEEDDYNFLSDEGEMEKETITTHLKNNAGHRGLISTLVQKNPLIREARKGGHNSKKGAAIPHDYASFVRKQKMQIPAPIQTISKLKMSKAPVDKIASPKFSVSEYNLSN